jgi:hypothetical protein
MVCEQEVSESTTRALELAEQRLAEAAAELQRRGAALVDIAAERDAATAEVGIFYHQQLSSWLCCTLRCL